MRVRHTSTAARRQPRLDTHPAGTVPNMRDEDMAALYGTPQAHTVDERVDGTWQRYTITPDGVQQHPDTP